MCPQSINQSILLLLASKLLPHRRPHSVLTHNTLLGCVNGYCLTFVTSLFLTENNCQWNRFLGFLTECWNLFCVAIALRTNSFTFKNLITISKLMICRTTDLSNWTYSRLWSVLLSGSWEHLFSPVIHVSYDCFECKRICQIYLRYPLILLTWLSLLHFLSKSENYSAFFDCQIELLSIMCGLTQQCLPK